MMWLKYFSEIKKKSKRGEFFFLQIGAHDSGRFDPIRRLVKKYDWNGILVEPMPYYFNKLKSKYRNQNGLIFENVVIANHDGETEFYTLKRGNWWVDFVEGGTQSSLFPHVMLKHGWFMWNMKKLIKKVRLPCVTLPTLLDRHSIKKIDLLVIDTEGYDFEIIKQIPWNFLKPSMIYFEHKHLSKTDRKECHELLGSRGYIICRGMQNTFAYQKVG